MISIKFRKYDFRIVYKDEKPYIFDEIRKKNILLTPEEWVRQNILHHLIYDLNYPKGKIAVEKEFSANHLKKRFDILVYNQLMEPFMLIECKAPEVVLSEKTIMQAANYNSSFASQYIMITNGNLSFCFENQQGKIVQLNQLPLFDKN